MKTFGNFVKALRLEKDITLRDFCKLTGIDSAYWSKVERGINEPPKNTVELGKIAQVLDISFNSEEFHELLKLADLIFVPEVPFTDSEILESLPLQFTSINGSTPTENQLKELVNIIRKTNSPD